MIVKHSPRKQVIIHEMAPYHNLQQMVDLLSSGLPPGTILQPIRWANGIALTFNPLQANTETIVRDRVKGILHWDHVTFAPMSVYKPTVKSANGFSIDVIDVSNNETFQAIAKFLNGYLKKKK